MIPGLRILPDVAIAAKRSVRSILLISKVPIEKIRSVGLDTSSMTSVALTKIIFDRWYRHPVRFTSMAPDLGRMLSSHDAGLLIGDPALQVDRTRYLTYDLAEEWVSRTARPFVFAFWAVREDALEFGDTDLAGVFQSSRDHGLQADNLNRTAGVWAPRLRLTADEVKTYLLENIYYHLDALCLEGLALFYQYGHECGALPAAPTLRFWEADRPVVR
jgi:chorismate dehydratase